MANHPARADARDSVGRQSRYLIVRAGLCGRPPHRFFFRPIYRGRRRALLFKRQRLTLFLYVYRDNARLLRGIRTSK